MSAFSWAAFLMCSAGVAIHYAVVGDVNTLAFGLPALMLLVAIPMALTWMSRSSFVQAEGRYRRQARLYHIGTICPGMSGSVVRVSGEVERVSFKWLRRPHYQVSDGTGGIRVIMFTAPAEKVRVGDRVDVLGVVMKGPFRPEKPTLSAVSVRKLQRKMSLKQRRM